MSQKTSDEFEPKDDVAEVRRRHRRWFVDFNTIVVVGEARLGCSVVDLSPGGACVELNETDKIAEGDRIDFELPGFGSIPAEVCYDTDGYHGLLFLHDDEGERELALYLVMVEQNRDS